MTVANDPEIVLPDHGVRSAHSGPGHGFPTEWCIADDLPGSTEAAPADEAARRTH